MLLDIPHIEQKAQHDCGPAVFQMVCSYLQAPTKRIKSDPIHGLHPFEIEPAFRMSGLHVMSGEMDADDLRYHTRRGRPVVCLIQRNNIGHWVVCRGLRGVWVYLCDPAEPEPRKVHGDEFVSIWADYDRLGTKYRQYAIAVG